MAQIHSPADSPVPADAHGGTGPVGASTSTLEWPISKTRLSMSSQSVGSGLDSVDERFDRVEQGLGFLKEVPQQLGAILESLAQVHTRLQEMEKAAAAAHHEDDDSSVGTEPSDVRHLGHEAPRISELFVRRPRYPPPHSLSTSTSSTSRSRLTVIGSLHCMPHLQHLPGCVSPLGGLSRRTSHSMSRRPSSHSVLAHQKDMNEHRRPSNQSNLSQAHAPRNDSAMAGRRQIAVPNLKVVPAQEASFVAPLDGPHHDNLDRCLSLAGNRRISRTSSILSFWESQQGPAANGQNWVLQPNGWTRQVWDVLVMLVTIVTGVLVPIELAYVGEPSLEKPGIILHAFDVVWILDVVLNFRTGFFSQRGSIVMSPSAIASRYMRNWLVPDVLAAWPFWLSPPGSFASWVLPLLKLLRLLRLGELCSRFQKKLHHISLFPLRVALVVLFSSHIMSCAWRVAQRVDGGAGGAGAEAKVGGNQWALYVQDTYWVLMTVTTVGYGDIYPETTGSRLYAILVMLVGPILSGTIVSGLTHATKGLFEDKVESRVAEATRFMNRRHVPHGLQHRVAHNLRHHLRQELHLDPELFAILSPAVQRELSLTLLSDTVLRFPLFAGTQHGFIAELAQSHSWVQCLPGDIVVEEGQLMQEMFFLIQGRLLVHRRITEEGKGLTDFASMSAGMAARDSTGHSEKDTDDVTCSGVAPHATLNCPAPQVAEPYKEYEVETGAWFGEASLFDEGCVHTATVAAAVESELAILPAREYRRIAEKFPRLQQRHTSIERAIRNKEVNISTLSYKAERPSESPGSKSQMSFSRRIPWLMRRVQASQTEEEEDEGWDAVMKSPNLQ